MKKINYTISTLLVFFLFNCSDYLDVVPDNLATLELSFSNQFTAEKYLYGCYSFIPIVDGENNNPAFLGADELRQPEALDINNGNVLSNGFQNTVSPRFNYWAGGNGGLNLNVGIRTCNIFIDNIDKVPGMDEVTKKQWKAEALFLKAYYHFYLVRMYGPIPINDEIVSVNAPSDEINQTRNTLEECFEYVIKLLDRAIVDLPSEIQNTIDDAGRATKSIAAAIKARALMTYASPLFNGNSLYANFRNRAGTLMFPSTYDPNKWERAATAVKEAIDLAEASGHELLQKTDYETSRVLNDTTIIKALLRQRMTKRFNKEIIWGSDGSRTITVQRHSMPRLEVYPENPVRSRTAVPLGIVETYYSENGVPIEEDFSYNYQNRYELQQAENKDRFYIEPNQETAILNYNREIRFYADLAFDRGVWYGNGREDESNPWYIRARSGDANNANSESNFSVSGYWPKKQISLKTVVNRGKSLSAFRYSFPIVRLADLYLYYAEALNEVKSAPDASVYRYIDLVRERAGLEGVVDSWQRYSNDPTKPLNKTGMRNIIQQERMIELAFEGIRFWDLRRWKLAETYMNRPLRGWTVESEIAEDYYIPRVVARPTFSQRDYLWPIRERDLIENPILVQNPGW